MTCQISTPTQQTKHGPIKQFTFTVCHSSSRCRLIAHIICKAFKRAFLIVHVRAVNSGFDWAQGDACLRADVRPACRYMARLDDPYRRTCFAKVGTRTCLHMRDCMCSFSNRWHALRRLEGEDRRQSERRGNSLWFSPLLFSSLLVFMTFAFYLPLTTAWGPKRGKPCFYLSLDGGLILYLPAL